jgi:Outer membrane protein beta-barrel domain
MSTLRWLPRMRHVYSLFASAALTLGFANAQTANPPGAPALNASESSSGESPLLALNALPAVPEPSGAAAGQEHGSYGGGYHSHDLWSHLTFEAGGGVNAPGGDSPKDITWGGNFTLGAGYRVTDHLSALVEYQFIDDKIPGALIAEAGATGGNDHIWSFTIDPVYDVLPKNSNDVYLTGGGGFYRKVTNFTDPEPTEFCSYFYCGVGYQNQVVGHFSSNQGGFSIGGGFQHRLGGMYGEGKARLFAEVRFLDVLSPALTTSPNGLGTTSVGSDTKVIPITLGVRW